MTLRMLQLIPGLILYGVADAFMIEAAVGVDPWTVFAQGLSRHTGMGIGLLTNIIGLLVLLLWIPLRQRPGIGTACNILLVGPGIELGLWLLPTPDELWVRVLFFAIGLVLLAVASGIYIGTDLGPGPRDGLMTGIHLRFGAPIWVGRTAVEASVLAIGWILGGDVGVGTLAFALLIGPLCNLTLPFFARGRRATVAADPASAVPRSAG
ncbi:YczE/YyaS/YitT family protein [Leucobacter ruminantium]|uniref:Membrane protein YczE n=1 Tax=Leucobacter ruminantium TaxID=1289170 RepID=A0A939LW61_9MICO|nr:hypothetical protein [Leucobacter ruminantium]MBO1804043.1 hypothetical protein [Leucobacter ruminantium]